MQRHTCLLVLVCLIGATAARSLDTQEGHLMSQPSRGLKQTNTTVSVGYSVNATYRVAIGGDALGALNASRDALARAGGGILRIEEGTYILSGQWILKSNNTQVIGAGMNRTTLKLQDKAAKFRYAGFIRATWVTNTVYSDFTIDGNKAAQLTSNASAMLQSSITYGRYCFYADGFTNLTFRRVRCQNCQGYGFDPHGIKFNPTIFSQGIDIQNCESIDNGWDGYTIDEIIGGVVANNYARGNGRHAYNIVTGTKNVVVRNNVAENTGFGSEKEKSGNGCGYVVNDNFELMTMNITVIGNKATNSNKAGFCILGAKNVQILNNEFNGAKVCGHITQQRTANILVSGNTCVAKNQTVIITGGALRSQIQIVNNTGF